MATTPIQERPIDRFARCRGAVNSIAATCGEIACLGAFVTFIGFLCMASAQAATLGDGSSDRASWLPLIALLLIAFLAVAWFVTGLRRTSRVIDNDEGLAPPLSPAARRLAGEAEAEDLDQLARGPRERAPQRGPAQFNEAPSDDAIARAVDRARFRRPSC